MASDPLIEEFEHCVTRLSEGASIDDCLQLYPQHQNELQVMLEATRIPQKAQLSYDEVRYSQARVRIQFEKALLQSAPHHRSLPLQRVASILLLILFIGSLLTTGIVYASQDSLPGDSLYAVKRLTEQVQLTISSDRDTLEASFNQRRIDETKQIIQLKREVDVRFVGVIDRLSDSALYVSDLLIEPSDSIETVGLAVGMRVEIIARTRQDQSLLASDIRILDLPDANEESDNLPRGMIATVEATDRIVISPTPSANQVTRESSATVEATAGERPTSDSIPTRLDSTVVESRDTGTNCDKASPEGWVSYTIQSGDTPLGIATGTDISLDEFYEVNCDLDPRLIVVGDVVFVPFEPRLARTANALDRPRATQPATMMPNSSSTHTPPDVRPTQTASRQTDTSSDQRKENNNNQEKNDGRR